MRRRKLQAAILGLVILLVASAIALKPTSVQRPVTSIARATFARIQPGMSVAEVTAILGPSGDRSTMDTELGPDFDMNDFVGTRGVSIAKILIWNTDSASVIVCFDTSGKVGSAIYTPQQPSTESSSTKLYKRIKRLWERWFP
jgi:hypothetical protein